MKILSSEVACCLYKSTIRPCMEDCFHYWASASSCSLNMWDKLRKWECRTVSHSLETLPHCLNVATVSLFCGYYFGRCSSELAQLVLLPYLSGRSLAIPVVCMIFLSPFLDLIKMYVNFFFPRIARLQFFACRMIFFDL